MEDHTLRRARWILVAVALGTLLAAPAHAALTPAQQVCQSSVGRQGYAFLRNVTRALRRCKDLISHGTLPPGTDCALEPTAAAKIARATSLLGTGLARHCDDATVASLTFGDSCYGSATVGALATCEAGVHLDQAGRFVDSVFDGSSTETGSALSCQKTASLQASNFAFKKLDQMRRCEDSLSQGKLPGGTDCTSQVAAPVQKARIGAASSIGKKCADATVASLDFGAPCTGVTKSVGLIGCLIGSHDDGVDRLVSAEYGRGRGPSSLKLVTNAPAECIKGPLARCRNGDYIFANDRIRVVVQSIQRNLLNVGQFGGQIIDADLVRAPGDPDRDNFEEWATSINIENTAHYTDLTLINDGSDGQPAILRATGVDDLLDFVNPSSVVADFGFAFPPSANDTDLPVEIQTDYILEPGRNWIRVETTVHNTGAAPFSIFFGEYLGGSGEIETFQPGYGFGEPLVAASCPASATNPCNVIAYGAYGGATGLSYGYVHDVPGSSSFSTSGVTVPLLGTETVLALIGAASQNFPLAAVGDPGDSITFTREFVVGDGSVSSIFDARNKIQYLATGTLEGTVTIGGAPTGVGTRVSVLGSPTQGPGAPLGALASRNVVTQAVTDANGHYSLTVPGGSYNVVAGEEGTPYQGGGSAPQLNAVTVSAYNTSTLDIALPATGAIHVNVTDENGAPISAKLTVVGFDPSPPFANTQSIFGLINNRTGVFRDIGLDPPPFGIAQVAFVGPGGDSGQVTLEPGTYQLVASHGPEYSVATANVTVTAGATTPASMQVARVIDSTGFISADFHVHSIDSPDSKVTKHDRVVSMLAEGVDFFTPSDHESRQDFNPAIAEVGATGLISVAVSGEITTFDYGHFNAWPMTIDPTKVNGGSVDHGGAAPDGMDFPQYGNYSLTPAQIIAAAHADPGQDTVQINHIHSFFGLGGNSGLAIDTGVTPPQSAIPASVRRLDPSVTNYFTDTFDALEVWIESSRSGVHDNVFGRNLGDWFNLLNQGIVRTAVADSDTHKRITTQSGGPRNFVASPTDSPAALGAIAETLSSNVNAGRTLGTNGPFMRVTATAASTGEVGGLELGLPTTISTTDGAVDVTFEIQSPVWAPFDRIEVYVNSATTRSTVQKQSGVGLITVPSYAITPDYVLDAGTDFTVSTVQVVPAIPAAQRLETTATLSLTGLTQDVWIVAIARGTDGVSRPLFPVVPNDLRSTGNTTLANLTDGNLGEDGIMAMTFSNPLFIDVDGGGWTAPGVQLTP